MAIQRIEIVLPNRIGDTILTLPAIVCLKQLKEKYASVHLEYELITSLPLTEILQALELFKVRRMSLCSKIKSWLVPADKTFFLSTTTGNMGYHSKESHGLRLPNKKHIIYSVDMPYLHIPHAESVLPEQLVKFLKSEFELTSAQIRHFGICLDMGYTVEQIRDTFRFDAEKLAINNDFLNGNRP